MKITKAFSLFIALTMLLVLVGPAYAQLGEQDETIITVQNISGTDDVEVTIKFIAENGTEYIPSDLGGGLANPFSLDDGDTKEIYVSTIPSAQLPSDRYSVIISSTDQVVAIALLEGNPITDTPRFSGTYSGMKAGASPFYVPSFVYNFYDWYSLLSVQNLGSNPANITAYITCADGTTGTMSATGVPTMASHHFVTKSETPTGFTTETECNGSVKIIEASGQPLIATDNQSKPAGGNTISISGITDGSTTLFVPALYKYYYKWNSSLNIQKLEAGDTTVTVTYSDSGTSTCNLTDIQPGCLLYMPDEHPVKGMFGATITNSASKKIGAVSNSTRQTLSLAYTALDSSYGSQEVAIPSVMKKYFKWNSSFTCQLMNSTATQLNIAYEGKTPYDHPTTLSNPGDSVEIYQPEEPDTLLPDGYQGGVTVTAKATGANIACIVNFTNNYKNDPTKPGDWSASYNAFGR